jgi:hypothetical protein
MVLVLLTLGSFAASAQSVERLSTIISGKLSISGSSNRSALNDAALKGLCEDGYTMAIFTYPGAKARTVECGGGRTISYQSITGWENPTRHVSKIAGEVHAGGKVLVHCWYGVHASKFVASAALTKLCGFSGDQAASFFRRGIPKGSLSESRINELAGKLSQWTTSGGVTSGCPSP